MIIATDLDRTLIYSRAAMSAAGDPADLAVVAVERYDGADASWMSAAAPTVSPSCTDVRWWCR